MKRRTQPGQKSRRRGQAATADILGNPRSAPRIPSKFKREYQLLLELRSILARRQSGLAQDAREELPSFSSHQADAATDSYDRDFALGLLSSEQDAAYEIDEALARIRSGIYGKCELTGKAIEPERLAAIPWTRFSAGAERELEREGLVKHAQLGALASATDTAPPAEESEEA